MNGSPIRVPKTAEVIAARIRKSIVRGELAPGDNLPLEANLVNEFAVSRATVREAMRILEFEGLITLSRGMRGGARVNAVGTEILARTTGILLQARGATIGEVYQARSLIEPPAARLSARTRPKAAAEALRHQLELEHSVIDDEGKLWPAVAGFHRILLEQCGNVALAVVGQSLHDVVQRHLELAYRLKSNTPERNLKLVKKGLKSQEKLIELIEAGDGEGAELHWAHLMRSSGEYWLAGLAATSVVDVID